MNFLSWIDFPVNEDTAVSPSPAPEFSHLDRYRETLNNVDGNNYRSRFDFLLLWLMSVDLEQRMKSIAKVKVSVRI